MPANGRWDLIRRLKVIHTCLATSRKSSNTKSDSFYLTFHYRFLKDIFNYYGCGGSMISERSVGNEEEGNSGGLIQTTLTEFAWTGGS